ncbi:phosphopantothenoylcysteine decarboxylase [Renibacterium salmoninarum ATCC 33209]|uniref:Coenzyme A biosynthesis bifunctional protein CoaBC n=1 Tax=Renibacterium salmoninarum (strain ATCC 33209 / DSM 20767 / JCM 11484 / NBRC 15589 / NCIMB 2235) TaxID=288705 RepID=A9WSA2_RENSM|nr:bifunctional phosphopantothenoylcysteine decarboxylase/phosphopantothenate--cysteine ligase CoaBC [Renibacterium salmoninarum]ABY23690.1 phosphopantothenoylcysteine decarboxylase [Renibacterium salmoninarum ATCC 33209]
MRIILGVGGGIAAYKAASLLRLFTESGHHVTVIPTESALKFVGAATWEALSGQTVSNSVFDQVEKVNHVRLGHEADLIVVAPATADLLARAAGGHADDLLTNTLLMARGPVLFAPAMHSEMWANPATRANVKTLRERGIQVLEPATGRLTGSDSGPGRLPEPEAIFSAAMALLSESTLTIPVGQLQGLKAVITAGGTREPLDPVRFLGNRSSGKQGVALAIAARNAGADVTLIVGHLEVAVPDGVRVIQVDTALELQASAENAASDADLIIMAAAVADFRPDHTEGAKIKKRDDAADPVIHLVRNPDILAGLVASRDAEARTQLIIGFAAETGDEQGDVLHYAKAKLARKGCDFLVVNQVGADADGHERTFGQDSNQVLILDRDGSEPLAANGSKQKVANAVIDRIAAKLGLEN